MRTRRTLAAIAAGLLAGGAAASTTELAGVTRLSGGGNGMHWHACALTNSGGVKCWGENTHGELGSGLVSTTRTSATDVPGLTTGVAYVDASKGSHSCAVMETGAIKCWGLNDAGQLGDGTTIDRASPVDVQGLPWAAVAVVGGIAHTCALSNTGAVACWGRNGDGQLGDGTTTDRPAPTPVMGLPSGVVALYAGLYSTCALTDAGGVKCWGANFAGQLGDGTKTKRTSPVDASGLTSGVARLGGGGVEIPSTNFATGYYERVCAVMTSNTLKCWGGGTGVSGTAVTTPTDVSDVTFNLGAGPQVYPIGNLTAVTSGTIASYVPIGQIAFFPHYCGVTPAGGARCWDADYCGALGAGGGCNALPTFHQPPVVDVTGLSSGVAALASLGGMTTCALLTDGHVRCWGGTFYGSTPVSQAAGTTPQTIVFDAIASSMYSASQSGVSARGDGNPIVFTSLTPSTCSVTAAQPSSTAGSYSATVTALSGGTCTIAADQPGDAFFDAAPRITGNIAIDPRLAQTITFPVGATLPANGVVVPHATASSGLPVTLTTTSPFCWVSGDFVFALPANGASCAVTATQPGDATYGPAAPVTQTFSILPGSSQSAVAIYKSGGGDGTVTSSTPGIDCGATCAANFGSGTTVTLTATAAPGSKFNGWGGACSGSSPCTLTVPFPCTLPDAVCSSPQSVAAHFTSDTPRFVNLSTRGFVGTDSQVLIGGFVIGGTVPKTVVVRGLGPSLCASGVAGCIPDPVMRLVSITGATLAAQDDFTAATADGGLIGGMGFAVSAKEAAIVAKLAPGAYGAVIDSRGPAGPRPTGIGLFEVYEIDGGDQPLLNVSTRGLVQGGDGVMIAGFVIQGSGPQTVIVRGVGASMSAAGVANTLSDPVLTLVRLDGTVLATNDNWQTSPDASAITIAGFAPSDARESAIMMTLPEGAYGAILSGARGATGIGLVEVYRVGN